jgi:hypothetical protein
MTVSSGNGSITSTGTTTRTGTGTYNGAASSSAAPSSRFPSTSNYAETPPAYTVRDNGWIHMPKVRPTNFLFFITRLTSIFFQGFHEEVVPDFADDEVETFKDGDDDDEYDM